MELAQYKKTGRLKALVVTGCLAQRYREEIRKEMPEVDALVGTAGIDAIAVDVFPELDRLVLVDTNRVHTTGTYTSYLKIAEGCDKCCTYCIIPKIRGTYRSVPMERLVKEAEFLAAGGAKELVLVAQETTLYGVDLYGGKKLSELIKKLAAIDGIRWIRLLYCYPEEITDDMIQTIKEEPKLCHYLDMPIQHASDKILMEMGRKTNYKQLTQLVAKLRREIPDIVLRTTLITGFPGRRKKIMKY